MKHYFVLVLVALMLSPVALAQHRAITTSNTHWPYRETDDPKSIFPRQGFSLLSTIPLHDSEPMFFYAGGSIDTRLSYFDLTFSGDLTNKDILVRIDYGMNVLSFIDRSRTKVCVSLGISGIIGIHTEDWKTSVYEWYFKAPSFVTGLKCHFDRYSFTVGWQQDYAIFEKLKDGAKISEDYLKKGSLFLKFCVY